MLNRGVATAMRAAIFKGPRAVEIGDRPDPVIVRADGREELLDDVLDAKIDPGRVFHYETDLDGIANAYAAMDERRAIKSLVRVGAI